MRLTISTTPRTREARRSSALTGSSADCTPESTTTPARVSTRMSSLTMPSSSSTMRITSAVMR